MECEWKGMEWKRADTMPIYKKGNKEEPFNHRPVSLTSIVCKICEIIKKQWTDYLEREVILSDRQFGFRSCVTNLLSFYSRVINITQERDGWADSIHSDLLNAFDKEEITMEVGTHWRIERNIKELDGRLPERKGNENSSKR